MRVCLMEAVGTWLILEDPPIVSILGFLHGSFRGEKAATAGWSPESPSDQCCPQCLQQERPAAGPRGLPGH